MQTILGKAWEAYKEGRLLSTVSSRSKHQIEGLRYLFNDPASKLVTLHSPEYTEPVKDDHEAAVVARIFQSFRKMKEDQRTAPDIYRPSSLWQETLDKSYCYLTEGLESNDVDRFHFFLSNFGSWKEYHGVENTTLIREGATSTLKARHLTNVMFYQQLMRWKWFYNDRKPVSALAYPTYGNQSGAYIGETFVGVGSFFNEIYGSILSGILDDIERPVVADLGAGYGKLAYFTLRDIWTSCFIDFDLPETLCLAAYYLMMTWPDKRALLYGEAEYSSEAHDSYDLIFMPSYEITKAGDQTVDLFINKNSLGEMTREATANYIEWIARSTNYFFHLNHDIHPDVYSEGEHCLLAHEYPVPMDKFKLLFRYADLGHMLGQELESDIFLYLYERVGSSDLDPE